MPNRPTGPAEGEALRRLKTLAAIGACAAHEWYFDAALNIDEVPPNGHVNDGSSEFGFDTCPHPDCVLVRAPLSGPVDASGEPASFDTDKAVAELKAAGWVSDGYGTRWTAPDGVIWRGPAGAWRVMCRQRDEALCRDGSTPEHPRLDGSYGWPKTPRGEAEALTDDFRRKWPNVQGIDRESLVGWFQTAMCIGAQSAAAAVPSSPAQESDYRLCGYCHVWATKPCGEQCAWSPLGHTVEQERAALPPSSPAEPREPDVVPLDADVPESLVPVPSPPAQEQEDWTAHAERLKSAIPRAHSQNYQFGYDCGVSDMLAVVLNLTKHPAALPPSSPVVDSPKDSH